MLLHLHQGFHHTKRHLDQFEVKHNVWARTIGLLAVLAVQINVLSNFWMLPIQNVSTDESLTFAWSILPIDTEWFEHFMYYIGL